MIKISELTKEYYRPGELAEMTGRSTRTIQNYCIDGRIKCKITEKGRRMIARDEMIKHLRKCRMISMEEERMDIAYTRADVNSACNIMKKYLLKVAGNCKKLLHELVEVFSMPCLKIKTF